MMKRKFSMRSILQIWSLCHNKSRDFNSACCSTAKALLGGSQIAIESARPPTIACATSPASATSSRLCRSAFQHRPFCLFVVVVVVVVMPKSSGAAASDFLALRHSLRFFLHFAHFFLLASDFAVGTFTTSAASASDHTTGLISSLKGDFAVLCLFATTVGFSSLTVLCLFATTVGFSSLTSLGMKRARFAQLASADPPLGPSTHLNRLPSSHSPVRFSPFAVEDVPFPCCFPSFHSPSYSRPSGDLNMPRPCFMSFRYSPS